MRLRVLLCALLATAAAAAAVAAAGGGGGGAGPRFAGRQRRGAVGVRALTADLDCLVVDQGPYTVSWVRSRDLQILSHGGAVFTADPRVALQVARLPGDVTRHRLTLAQLRDADAGRYECQLNTEPKMSLLFHLTVLDEAVAEAAAEWAAERRAPPLTAPQSSSTEAMQRDESPAASEAARGCVTSPAAAACIYLLLTAMMRLLDT